MSNLPTNTETVEQIKALLHTYERALNTSDAALATSVYSPGGIFMPHFAPTASGPAILGAYEQIFAAIKLAITFYVDEVNVEGNTAYALTRSEGQQTILATGSTSPEANRELFALQRHEGTWKIACYMFNKTSPAVA